MALYKSFAIYINQIFQEFWLRRGLNNLNAQRKSIVCDLDLRPSADEGVSRPKLLGKYRSKFKLFK